MKSDENNEDPSPYGVKPDWVRREEELRGRHLTKEELDAATMTSLSGTFEKRSLKKRAMRRAIWAVGGQPPRKPKS